MPETALYLFKAARRPLYLKENLRLLAAERGTVVEVAYNRSWVAPEYFEPDSIARGATVYVILTDRPYNLFVPVREGEIVATRTEEPMLRIRVLLKNWIGVEDVDLETFTRLVKQADPERAPGRKFVAPKRDGVTLVSYYDEREDAGWRQAVENTLAMSGGSEDNPYSESIFFRPAGLSVEGGDPLVARRVPLDPGTHASLLLHFHNPHLENAELGHYKLRALAPDDELLVKGADRLPCEGELNLGIEYLGGRPSLTLQIAPASAQHTHVVERFIGGDDEATDSTLWGDPAARRKEILGIYDFVRRNATFGDGGDEIDFYGLFGRLLPDEQHIAEERARRQYERGEEEEALRSLRDLNPEVMGDKARFLHFNLVLRYGKDRDPVHQIGALGLTEEGRFDRLLEELAKLDSRMLARLVPRLVEDLATEQVRQLMSCVGDRIESPDAIAQTGRHLYLVTDNAEWAYDFVRGRSNALRLNDPLILDTLVELARAGGRTEPNPELADDAARRIRNLIGRDRFDEAGARLREAGRAFDTAARAKLYHKVVDRLLEKDRGEQAARILVELAFAACEDGALTEATDTAERARGVWAGIPDSGEPPEWLLSALEHIQKAWEDCSELVDWRKTDEERRREDLRAKLLNKRILIAGGIRQSDWEGKLQYMTGAEVEWAEHYRGQGADLDAIAERIRNGQYDIVIHLLQKSGHELQNRLKAVCAKHSVQFLPAKSAGFRGLIAPLVQMV